MAFELAQLNIARLREPLDSPALAGFVSNLDRVNALAEAAPGFVWRLKDDSGNATGTRPFGDDILVNLSVWRDIDALAHYVYKSAHADILRRRREWFERTAEATLVLWWVPAGHRPTIQEASERLDLLRSQGPSPEAFTFSSRFNPPERGY